MIDELKAQTKGTVINYLKDLGQNTELYSNTSKGVDPLLSNHDVYIYADLNEVVLIVFDPRPSRMAELADEEPFNDEHPLWFSESSHRESPVWKLAVTCEMYRERLRRLSHHAPKVWGVLVTGCEVINYDDMIDVWAILGISVFDRVSGLGRLKFPVNADASLSIAASMSYVFEGDYSHANITDAEKKLRREMEKAYNPKKTALFNFDDDDDDLGPEFAAFFNNDDEDKQDADDDEKSADCDLNDAVQEEPASFENHLRKVIHNEGQSENRFMNKVSDMTIEVFTGYQPQLYCDGSLIVTLTAKKGSYFKLDDFRCYVYSKDLHAMCNSLEASEIKRLKGSRLTIEMASCCIWLPGSYFLLLIDGSEMVQRVDFTLDENLCATVGGWVDCMPCSQEDILISCLQNKILCWPQLAMFPGGEQLRQWVVRRMQLDAYNSYRNSLHKQKIGFSSNLLICKRNDDIDERFLNMFYEMSAIKDHSFRYVDCSRLYDGTRPNPYEPLNEKLVSLNKEVICLANLGTLLNTGGKVIIRRVMDLVFNKKRGNILWLCGSRQQVDALLNMYPSLGALFLKDNRLEQEAYSAFDLVQAFRHRLMQEFLYIPDEVKDVMARAIIKGCANQSMSNWSLERINRHVAEEVCPHYVQHALSTILSENLSDLSVEDLCLDRLTTGSSSFEESIHELNQMIGLDSVKEGIRTMANNARLFIERRRRGLKCSEDQVYHCVFTGNPGTGKTTVAKMLGRIYHSLGLLSKGEVVYVDRTKLVGQFIGETEANMKTILEEARGNVLFIDEAYTLFVGGDDRKDFGLRVIDSLMTILSQPNPDMLIVFAGYPKEMEALLTTNPGLSSRFPYRYLFPDYNQEQLMEIARSLLDRDEYILTAEAETAFQEVIKEVLQKNPKNFGNARWINQMVKNGIVPALANRVFSAGSDDFQHIEASDVRIAYEKLNPKPIEQEKKPGHKRVAGFCAMILALMMMFSGCQQNKAGNALDLDSLDAMSYEVDKVYEPLTASSPSEASEAAGVFASTARFRMVNTYQVLADQFSEMLDEDWFKQDHALWEDVYKEYEETHANAFGRNTSYMLCMAEKALCELRRTILMEEIGYFDVERDGAAEWYVEADEISWKPEQKAIRLWYEHRIKMAEKLGNTNLAEYVRKMTYKTVFIYQRLQLDYHYDFEKM